MRDLFSEFYHENTREETETMLKTGLVVIDTNTLLHVYRYPPKARDDLLQCFRKVEDRIWLPHMVALEYQNNRLSVIASVGSVKAEVKKAIEPILSSIDTAVASIASQKDRHSAFNAPEFQEVLRGMGEQLRQRLDAFPKPTLEDPIRTVLDDLFKDKVGAAPSDTDLKDWYKDGADRYEKKRPPGFRDKDKKDVIYHRGLEYRRCFSDYVIWRQIVHHCNELSAAALVFVTDDKKDDWWEEGGGQKIGPRRELREEILQDAPSVKLFNLLTPSSFLKYAKETLGVEVETDSIRAVKQLERLDPSRNRTGLAVYGELKGSLLRLQRQAIEVLGHIQVWTAQESRDQLQLLTELLVLASLSAQRARFPECDDIRTLFILVEQCLVGGKIVFKRIKELCIDILRVTSALLVHINQEFGEELEAEPDTKPAVVGSVDP